MAREGFLRKLLLWYVGAKVIRIGFESLARLARSALLLVSVMIAGSLLVQNAYAWSWSISWKFDKDQYPPGASGSVDLSLQNTGNERLQVYGAGIQFQWQEAANVWTSVSVNIVLDPGQTSGLGKVGFGIPNALTEGNYRFRVGVAQKHLETVVTPFGLTQQWVDDGVQFVNEYRQIKITSPRPALAILKDIIVPPLTETVFPGDSFVVTVVVENSGSLAAQQVTVTIEQLNPRDGLIVAPMTAAKDLPPNTLSEWLVRVSVVAPASYRGLIVASIAGQKTAQKEWSLTVTNPDLSVTQVKLSGGQEQNIVAGATFEAAVTVRNNMGITIPQVSVAIEDLDRDAFSIVSTDSVKDLDARATSTWTLRLKALKTGAYKLAFAVKVRDYPATKSTLSLTVQEAPVWQSPIFLGAVAVVGVGVVVGFVLYRRRQVSAPLGTATVQAGSPAPMQASHCNECGRPLTFVREKRQFYCANCKKYTAA